MKNNWMNFIFSFVPLTGFVAHAGGVYVGNGGDAVFCQASKDNSFQGYYTLDYLMTLSNTNDVAKVQSWEKSRDRIRGLLKSGSPALLESFDKFLLDLNNQSDWTKKRIWLSAPHGLVDIQDEQIRRKLPENCGYEGGEDRPSLIQVVVRNKQPQITRYEYDEQVLNELKAQPLQISFLLVHEWLWDHSEDPQVIRWANHFLHSKTAESLSHSAFNTSLTNIGITAKAPGFVSVCERSPGVAKSIVDHFRKSCEFVTREELGSKLERIFTNDAHLDVNDFADMPRLNEFHLTDSAIQRLPMGMFDSNPYLAFVELSNLPDLKEIPEDIFAKNPKVVNFTMKNVGWSPQNLNFLSGTSLYGLTLNGLTHKFLPKDFLAPLPASVDQIYLLHGKFTDVEPGFFAAIKNKRAMVQMSGLQFTSQVKLRLYSEAKAAGIRLVF